ncbi:hypothetical protein GGX14DRAFT_407195 [Mycena pura]|uniref:Uncharacterized protein n=1 Tax=Mycena pura TaxID=153505 RepID=A0AAD6UVR1_9AGAR|nr:hypothetical protein GGX14DRAFT_407195 [Mycena pura]
MRLPATMRLPAFDLTVLHARSLGGGRARAGKQAYIWGASVGMWAVRAGGCQLERRRMQAGVEDVEQTSSTGGRAQTQHGGARGAWVDRSLKFIRQTVLMSKNHALLRDPRNPGGRALTDSGSGRVLTDGGGARTRTDGGGAHARTEGGGGARSYSACAYTRRRRAHLCRRRRRAHTYRRRARPPLHTAVTAAPRAPLQMAAAHMRLQKARTLTHGARALMEGGGARTRTDGGGVHAPAEGGGGAHPYTVVVRVRLHTAATPPPCLRAGAPGAVCKGGRAAAFRARAAAVCKGTLLAPSGARGAAVWKSACATVYKGACAAAACKGAHVAAVCKRTRTTTVRVRATSVGPGARAAALRKRARTVCKGARLLQTRESHPAALSPILQSGIMGLGHQKWDSAIKSGTARVPVPLFSYILWKPRCTAASRSASRCPLSVTRATGQDRAATQVVSAGAAWLHDWLAACTRAQPEKERRGVAIDGSKFGGIPNSQILGEILGLLSFNKNFYPRVAQPPACTFPDADRCVVPKYNWTYPSLAIIFCEEGARALYKGFVPRCCVTPGGGVLLLVVESMLGVFRQIDTPRAADVTVQYSGPVTKLADRII